MMVRLCPGLCPGLFKPRYDFEQFASTSVAPCQISLQRPIPQDLLNRNITHTIYHFICDSHEQHASKVLGPAVLQGSSALFIDHDEISSTYLSCIDLLMTAYAIRFSTFSYVRRES